MTVNSSETIMPAMRKHEGVWTGVYTHVDAQGRILDQHDTRIVCEFPKVGPVIYAQHNLFTWSDGKQLRNYLPGTLENGKLWWDTPTFKGYAWETHDDVIMLNLTRKDEPGAYFIEAIILGATGTHRSRTWHWFKDGALYKRTLCEEQRVSIQTPKTDRAYNPELA